MQLSGLDYVLWVATFIGHITLLFILAFRRLAKTIPIFTSLITFLIVRTVVLYFVLSHLGAYGYYWTYWPLQAGEILLDLGVVAEVTLQVFRPIGEIVPDARMPLVIIIVLGMFSALLFAMLAKPSYDSTVGIFVSRADFFSFAVLTQLLVGFAYLWNRIYLVPSQTASRVVIGLGGYASASLAVTGLQAIVGQSGGGRIYQWLSWLQVFSYASSLAFWVIAFSKKPTPAKVMPPELKQQLERLSAYSALVLKMLQSMPGK